MVSLTCVHMSIEWAVRFGQTRALTIALHSIAAETRAMHGCVGCSVAADLGHGGLVRYAEDWQTEDDLRQRLRSDTFGHLATLIEDAAEPPRILFTLPHQTRGLDFVEEVRQATP